MKLINWKRLQNWKKKVKKVKTSSSFRYPHIDELYYICVEGMFEEKFHKVGRNKWRCIGHLTECPLCTVGSYIDILSLEYHDLLEFKNLIKTWTNYWYPATNESMREVFFIKVQEKIHTSAKFLRCEPAMGSENWSFIVPGCCEDVSEEEFRQLHKIFKTPLTAPVFSCDKAVVNQMLTTALTVLEKIERRLGNE